jgi:hypothetical protein
MLLLMCCYQPSMLLLATGVSMRMLNSRYRNNTLKGMRARKDHLHWELLMSDMHQWVSSASSPLFNCLICSFASWRIFALQLTLTLRLLLPFTLCLLLFDLSSLFSLYIDLGFCLVLGCLLKKLWVNFSTLISFVSWRQAWVFAWLGTSKQLYLVYATVYLAPYLRHVALLFCSAHVLLRSLQNLSCKSCSGLLLNPSNWYKRARFLFYV